MTERFCQPMSEFLRIVIGPEMHEEQARRIVEHMVMQRRHLDTVFAQSLEDRVHLGGCEHEIAGDSAMPPSRGVSERGMPNA